MVASVAGCCFLPEFSFLLPPPHPFIRLLRRLKKRKPGHGSLKKALCPQRTAFLIWNNVPRESKQATMVNSLSLFKMLLYRVRK